LRNITFSLPLCGLLGVTEMKGLSKKTSHWINDCVLWLTVIKYRVNMVYRKFFVNYPKCFFLTILKSQLTKDGKWYICSFTNLFYVRLNVIFSKEVSKLSVHNNLHWPAFLFTIGKLTFFINYMCTIPKNNPNQPPKSEMKFQKVYM
jgi:hypothetical protein